MTEHKLCTIITVFFLLISLLTTTSSMNLNAQTVKAPEVGVYYYPWYTGNWTADHWNCPDTPYIGRYNSSNTTLIVQHLNWLEQLGIDFIIFSWWGKDSPSDNNTKLILNQIKQNYTNLQFFIMVEPFGMRWKEVYESTTGVYNFSMIYNYIYDTYSSKFSANCFLLDGKPAIGFYDGPDRNLTRNGIPADIRFTTRLIGCQEYDDWEYQVPNATLSTQPVCRDGEISVCPRYDKDNQHLDVNYTEGLYDTQWSKAISEAGKGNVKIITIISWNEFAERTQIEPTFDTTSAYRDNPFYLYTKTRNYINDLVSITAASDESQVITQAVNYLVNNYNRTIGLVHESPDESSLSNTYWLYSDNYLVELVLALYATDNTTIATINRSISQNMGYWLSTQHEIANQYQVLNDSKAFPFNNSGNYSIGNQGIATIKCTVNNGTFDPDTYARNYADIAFLESIAYHKQGDYYNANRTYFLGYKTWDGVGFKDSSYNSSRGYDTFKLALYILASKNLNYSYDSKAYNILLSCQLTSGVAGSDDSGGFASYYFSNGETNNQTNTETTALAILALYNNQGPDSSPSEIPFVTIIAILLAAIGLTVVIAKKHRTRALY